MATTYIYTLSLHDALPILLCSIKLGISIISRSYMRILEIMLEHVIAANDVEETRNFTNYIQFLYTALSIRLRSEEHTSELQSRENLVCRLLLEKKKK